ncbi:MAG: HAD-IB family phosphatase [Candidatus Thermoplasmatota archaeon]|nr:HAD-IB family phosphatase [Candidatus Thermoplasmatota archaeon]
MAEFKLVIFDMDGTLLKGRTIFVFAEEKGFKEDLLRIIGSNIKPYEKTIEIAKFLKDMDSRELLEIFRDIPLQEDVEKVVKKFKKKNIITAIATDSYKFVADDLKKRLGIDYAFANTLITEKDIITGEVILHNTSLTEEFIGHEVYSICKSCVLEQLCNEFGITEDETMAVGDGVVDICMLERAGLGIAFNAPEIVQKHADVVTDNMNVILKHI